MTRLRTGELADLAKTAGFTSTELSRAVLDGAMKLLHSIATKPQPHITPEQQENFLDLAARLERVQTQISFIDGIPAG